MFKKFLKAIGWYSLCNFADSTILPMFGIRPSSDSAEDLGTPVYRYQDLYLNGQLSNGAKSIPVEKLLDIQDIGDHTLLTQDSRSAANQHPIYAITGLQGALDSKVNTVDIAPLDQIVRYTIDGTKSIQLQNSGKYQGTTSTNDVVNIAGIDENNDVEVGSPTQFTRIYSAGRPFILTPNTEDPDSPIQNNAAYVSDIPTDVVEHAEIADFVTEAEVTEDLAYKADLVGGTVPTSQLPPGAISKNFTVDEQADLVTLTTAVPNDRALVLNTAESGPEEIWLLWTADPTVATNWQNITGSGGDVGAVTSVNGMQGSVTVDLDNLPNVQNALADKADSTDLGGYLPLTGGTMSGNIALPPSGSVSFGALAGDTNAFKIDLYGRAYGLGIEPSTLRYSVNTGAQHKWYAGATTLGYWNATDLYVGSTGVKTTLAQKAPLASPTFTGIVRVPKFRDTSPDAVPIFLATNSDILFGNASQAATWESGVYPTGPLNLVGGSGGTSLNLVGINRLVFQSYFGDTVPKVMGILDATGLYINAIANGGRPAGYVVTSPTGTIEGGFSAPNYSASVRKNFGSGSGSRTMTENGFIFGEGVFAPTTATTAWVTVNGLVAYNISIVPNATNSVNFGPIPVSAGDVVVNGTKATMYFYPVK